MESSGLNQRVRGTSVKDLNIHFEGLKLELEGRKLPFKGVGEYIPSTNIH